MPHTVIIDNNIYSIDMMIAYINIFKPKPITVKVANLLTNLSFEGWSKLNGDRRWFSAEDVLSNPEKYPNRSKAIDAANISYPLIIIDKYTVVDGIHRLAKAYKKGKKMIKTYRFSKKLLKKFMIKKKHLNGKVRLHKLIRLFYKRFLQ
jgi:hypothetical protein